MTPSVEALKKKTFRHNLAGPEMKHSFEHMQIYSQRQMAEGK